MGKALTPIVPLDSDFLSHRLSELGVALSRGALEPREIQHLVSVVLRCSAWLGDVYTEERMRTILTEDPSRLVAFLSPAWLGSISDDPRDVVRRLRQLPDSVREVGDHALFDLSLSGRRSIRGVDLLRLGPRAYRLAARVLHYLAESSRGRRGDVDATSDTSERMEEEAAFLRRCAARFDLYSQLLRALGDPEPPLQGLLPAPAPGSRALIPGVEIEGDAPLGAGFDDPSLAEDLLRVPGLEEAGEQQGERLLAALERLLLFANLDLEQMRQELESVVIDQSEAIATLCDDLALMAVGTQRVNKPLGYFLVGPTGVGKNYLVETLVRVFEHQWKVEVPLLTIEGPNYTYPSDINELRGATRGFIRSDEPGLLSEFHKAAAQAPLSVVLVDEVEKAHPQLRRFFLSILDRGTITDAQGEELLFDGVLIFFTSNIGYKERGVGGGPIGFGGRKSVEAAFHAQLSQSLRRTLSPEFINRVKLVRFRHLPRSSAERIAVLEFSRIATRYRQLHGLELVLTPEGREALVDQGYSHEYGARRLASVIQRACNVEIGKMIRRDETRGQRDLSDLLEMVRHAKEDSDQADLVELSRRVRESAKAQVPYSRIIVGAAGGELVYRTEP